MYYVHIDNTGSHVTGYYDQATNVILKFLKKLVIKTVTELVFQEETSHPQVNSFGSASLTRDKYWREESF